MSSSSCRSGDEGSRQVGGKATQTTRSPHIECWNAFAARLAVHCRQSWLISKAQHNKSSTLMRLIVGAKPIASETITLSGNK